jgi:hypothetical protein
MPLILSVDLTEIALFRNSDETSGHRDLIIGSQIWPWTSHRFRKLSLAERRPAFRRASDVAETKEQVSDFSQCNPESTVRMTCRSLAV